MTLIKPGPAQRLGLGLASVGRNIRVSCQNRGYALDFAQACSELGNGPCASNFDLKGDNPRSLCSACSRFILLDIMVSLDRPNSSASCAGCRSSWKRLTENSCCVQTARVVPKRPYRSAIQSCADLRR